MSQSMRKPKQLDRRWYSIEGRYIKWYDQPNSAKLSGLLDLASAEEIKAIDSGTGAFKFVIIFQDRKLVLGATDDDDRNKWISALQYQADLAKVERAVEDVGECRYYTIN